MSKQNPKASSAQMNQSMATSVEKTAPTEAPANQPETEATAMDETAPDATTEASPEAEKDLVVEPEPAPQQTQAEKVIVIEAVEPKAENATLQERLANILKTVPEAHQIDIHRIMIYLDRMAPNRPMNAAAGAKEQVALYRSIQNIINRQGEYFTQLFSAVLAIFKSEFKGALGDKHRLRFLESIELGTGDRKAFNHLTHLLYVTADPRSRGKALEMVNMDRALENGLTAEGRARVLEYFNA